MIQAPTWNELMALLNSDAEPTDNKGWSVYRYLAANVGAELSSAEARTLLLIYMKLPLERPSLLHSMMLGAAVRMAAVYPDFKLPGFLAMWGIHNLRPEDRERQTGEQGRVFHSLAERLGKGVVRYRLLHPDEPFDAAVLSAVRMDAARLGFLPILPMVAVRVFEAMAQGRKMRFVKLVGPRGDELTASVQQFNEKPWEIAGRLYDVLPRRAADTGRVRVDSLVSSSQGIEQVFGRQIGYVDRYDEHHRHYHIYAPDSAHFVAAAPRVEPVVGGYVWFSPVVPLVDKFKSAIVLRTENVIEGRQAFGLTTARVTYVNEEKGYFCFQTDDGRKGSAAVKLSPRPLATGDEVRLILFLRRRKSNPAEKFPHVVEMI